ncbi:magnetosome protein Mad4 [Candidatus Magnetomorum sp. HK-1]|nr:magnetosome protein Mad4 [Candidatus Magnetomorum sp. HK-1]
MIEEYIPMDVKKLSLFTGSVIGTVVLTTLLYWFIYGFDLWQSQMNRASALMTAAAMVPAQPLQAYNGGAYNQNSSGQFVCPQHGSVGLPNYDATGLPHCPICGQIMQFHSAGNYLPQAQIMPHQNAVQPVAFGGGGGGG